MSYQDTYLTVDFQEFSTIFAMDWSFSTKSEICHKKRGRKRIVQASVSSDVKALKDYFSQFKGKKLLVFEETTGAHWLYVNLISDIDRIIICDPYRNSLLREGAKTDKIDSIKLLHLLLNNSLKEVYHNCSEIYHIRAFMSAYNDLIKREVVAKNQLAAFKRSRGIKKTNTSYLPEDQLERFSFIQLQEFIADCQKRKAAFEGKMKSIIRKHRVLRNFLKIPGYGMIISLTVYCSIVDPKRFSDKYKLYSYSDLALHQKESGKSVKGHRRGRCNPRLKWAYKAAAIAAIRGHNDVHDYYIYLLGKGLTEYNARNEVARYLCRVSWAMMKNGTKYEPYSWRKSMQ